MSTDDPINRLIEYAAMPLPKKELIGFEQWATHEGVLNIGGMTLRCYILENGHKIFNETDLAKYLKVAELFQKINNL